MNLLFERFGEHCNCNARWLDEKAISEKVVNPNADNRWSYYRYVESAV